MSKCQKSWKIGHNAKSTAGIVSTAQFRSQPPSPSRFDTKWDKLDLFRRHCTTTSVLGGGRQGDQVVPRLQANGEDGSLTDPDTLSSNEKRVI